MIISCSGHVIEIQIGFTQARLRRTALAGKKVRKFQDQKTALLKVPGWSD
jgi:hypothetical protein